MKPIILVMNKDNKIELTAERLQEIIDEAYKQGKEDASKATFSQPTKTTKAPYWWESPYQTWLGTTSCSSDSSTNTSTDTYAESKKYNY